MRWFWKKRYVPVRVASERTVQAERSLIEQRRKLEHEQELKRRINRAIERNHLAQHMLDALNSRRAD